MKEVHWAGLDAMVAGSGTGPIVVLVHGFGAPGDDLVPLADEISAPAGTRFVFPAAPLSLGPDSRAWWMIFWMSRAICAARFNCVMNLWICAMCWLELSRPASRFWKHASTS